MIATYALLADRSWVYNGKAEKAPALDQIGPGWALRAQERPSEEEYTRAHERAAALFGTSVPTVLYTRNVNALAADVRTKAEAREAAVSGLRRALARYRSALGITGEAPTAREQSVRDAADLLARIKQTPEATPLARDLAAATYVSTYFELGKVISSAQEVLDSLESTDWELIDSVRKYTARGDGLADRSERLLAEIADAASRNEPNTSLKPVLNAARGQAVALINEAARLSTVAPVLPLPPPTVAPEVNSPGSGTGHNSASPTTDDQSPLPSPPTTATAAPRRSRRVKASEGGHVQEHALNRTLTDVQDEIREYAATHPDVEIEIKWKVVQAGQDDGLSLPEGDL